MIRWRRWPHQKLLEPVTFIIERLLLRPLDFDHSTAEAQLVTGYANLDFVEGDAELGLVTGTARMFGG